MIDKKEINLNWINLVSKANRNADKILVEKVIRALLLLEGLAMQNLNFVFKGGTALMLHFNSTQRLSIDIDIVLPKKLKSLDEILSKLSDEQGFKRFEFQKRASQSNIEKAHYKFFYVPYHKTSKDEEYVLLDILYEEITYVELIEIPVESSFTPLLGASIKVKVPSLEDLLGDKLTAFAPNTTGIPYYKNKDSMSMEIVKQLYDIGNLFDVSKSLSIIKSTFKSFVAVELSYRDRIHLSIEDVLEDIFQTSLSIVSRGFLGTGKFEELQIGIQRLKGFIFSESLQIEKAIISASKAAYLSKLILSDAISFEKFEAPLQIKDWTIENPSFSKLNKLKKSNPQAFFYWHKIVNLI